MRASELAARMTYDTHRRGRASDAHHARHRVPTATPRITRRGGLANRTPCAALHGTRRTGYRRFVDGRALRPAALVRDDVKVFA